MGRGAHEPALHAVGQGVLPVHRREAAARRIDDPVRPGSYSRQDDRFLVHTRGFRFWDGAEPNSGMARERFHEDGIYPEDDKNVVTSGGTGFGVMASIGVTARRLFDDRHRLRLERLG